MNSITQDMRFRLSIVKFYNRISATKTAIRYKVTRQFIYFWVYRFNGDIHSLADHSHRPHHHPNQQSTLQLFQERFLPLPCYARALYVPR